MEGNKSRPRAILVFGAPCSGKTTFGEKFAKKFGLAFFDLKTIKDENNFTKKNILTILELILKTRQTILIEGVLDTEKEREVIRNLLRKSGYEPSLIWIQTDIATIRSRLKTRYKEIPKAKSVYEGAISEMEAPAEREHPIILSGKHTFETQSKHVISGLADLTDIK
ncbi:MAG: AAA family ATPase [Candidatus Saccharibacteria bacterium]|nr:AAA family ATPase [Candidatus Saccharibacteria bacterium]